MFAACRRSGLVPESVEVLVEARRRLGRREGRPARVTVVGCSSWPSRLTTPSRSPAARATPATCAAAGPCALPAARDRTYEQAGSPKLIALQGAVGARMACEHAHGTQRRHFEPHCRQAGACTAPFWLELPQTPQVGPIGLCLTTRSASHEAPVATHR
jgi:hypothetical protein